MIVHVTPEQARAVREAMQAAEQAQQRLSLLVSFAAAGHVPDGRQLLSVTESALLFANGSDDDATGVADAP